MQAGETVEIAYERIKKTVEEWKVKEEAGLRELYEMEVGGPTETVKETPAPAPKKKSVGLSFKVKPAKKTLEEPVVGVDEEDSPLNQKLPFEKDFDKKEEPDLKFEDLKSKYGLGNLKRT